MRQTLNVSRTHTQHTSCATQAHTHKCPTTKTMCNYVTWIMHLYRVIRMYKCCGDYICISLIQFQRSQQQQRQQQPRNETKKWELNVQCPFGFSFIILCTIKYSSSFCRTSVHVHGCLQLTRLASMFMHKLCNKIYWKSQRDSGEMERGSGSQRERERNMKIN